MLEDNIHKVMKHNNLHFPREITYVISKNHKEQTILHTFYTTYEVMKIYSEPSFSRWCCPFFDPIMPKKNKFDDYDRAMGIL